MRHVTTMFAAVAISLFATTFTPAAQPKAEIPPDILAAQLRRQGFQCGRAQSAARDTSSSKPDANVWTLTCDDGAYRLHLVPNQAARIERLN